MTASEDLDTNFFYNSMLAKALLQLFPRNDRIILRRWFDVLLEFNSNDDEKTIRNEYMLFILLMLQCQKIKEPFNKFPPEALLPLTEAVPKFVYEEVLLANDENMTWIDQAGVERGEDEITRAEILSSAPCKFVDNQPLPQEGVICYMAAFSDQS